MSIEWVVITALLLVGAVWGIGLYVACLRQDIRQLTSANSYLILDLRRAREDNLAIIDKIAEQAGHIRNRGTGGRFQKVAAPAPAQTPDAQKGFPN